MKRSLEYEFKSHSANLCGYDGTGRRSGLKIRWQKCRMDSNSIIRIHGLRYVFPNWSDEDLKNIPLLNVEWEVLQMYQNRCDFANFQHENALWPDGKRMTFSCFQHENKTFMITMVKFTSNILSIVLRSHECVSTIYECRFKRSVGSWYSGSTLMKQSRWFDSITSN